MKKRLFLTAVFALCIFLLTGCGCEHQWQEADCTAPKTCALCGETEGEPLPHDWQDASCTAPETCTLCGETEGEPLTHDWQDASCAAPKTCALCGETEGEPLTHDWQDASCAAPKTCALCGETEGELLPHDWQDASCAAPKICALCGETEGESLPHVWLDASCTAPKTCVVCSATEGKANEHRYGNWIFHGDYMERICPVCRTNDSRETDGSLILAEKLPGSWSFAGVERYNQFIEAGRLPVNGLDPYFSFDRDGRVSLLCADEGDEYTWEFSSFELEETDGSGLFRFKVLRNGEDYAHLCMHGTDTDRYLSLEKDGELCILRRSFNSSAVEGCWGCVEEGDYALRLDGDNRFVGYFDQQPVSGWWQLRPSYGSDEAHTLPLLLFFGEHGEERSILALAEGVDPEKNLLQQSYSMVFKLSDGHKQLSFTSRSSTYYDTLTDALDVSGEWISINLDYSNWNSGESYSIPTTDYSISFGENNSLHAVLMDGEISGTWELDEVLDEHSRSYMYNIYLGGSDSGYYFQRLDGGGSLLDGDYHYQMEQMDEEALAQFKKSMEMHSSAPLGLWTSVSLRTSDFTSGSSESRTEEYSISFNEDGSVHALLDREYTGTWEPLRISRHDDDLVQYSYDLKLDGLDEEVYVYCYLMPEKDSKGQLKVSVQSQENSTEHTYYFRQMDEAYFEQLAAMVGYWQPYEALWYNQSTQKFEPQEIDGDMYIEAFEDGSFRANFPSQFSGTWLYYGPDTDGDAAYRLSPDNDNPQMFYLSDDTLMGWYDSSGMSILVYFEKVEAPK